MQRDRCSEIDAARSMPPIKTSRAVMHLLFLSTQGSRAHQAAAIALLLEDEELAEACLRISI